MTNEQPGTTNESPTGTGSEQHHPTELTRRYRRLLWAYPAEYRAERGIEIIDTCLELTAPGRRWPSPADAVDLLRGGLRQRLRAAGALGLLAALPIAATLAYSTAVVLAGIWLGGVETTPPPPSYVQLGFGPFVSLGAPVWIAWLIAAGVAAISPGRWARIGIGLALLLTLTTLPVSAVTEIARPPLFVLVPQLALGSLALALPASSRPWLRLMPLVTAGIASAIAIANPVVWYVWYSYQLLPAVAAILLVVALATGVRYALRQDARGLWATLVLLGPAGLLATRPLAGFAGDTLGILNPEWSVFAGTAIAITALGLAAIWLAGALAARRASAAFASSAGAPGAIASDGGTSDAGPAFACCPTCGGPVATGPA
jgi:hypothetical protein